MRDAGFFKGWGLVMGLILRLIGLIFARIKALGWLAQWTPALWWVAEKVYDGNLKQDIYIELAREVSEKAGLELDRDEPFSDASMSNAVGQRLGFPLRSLKDRAMIKEDLENYAVQVISEKSGYVVRSITNVEMLKEDFVRIGAAELSARLGLPLGVMPGAGEAFDPVAVRSQLLIWAKAELFAQFEGSVGVSVDDIKGMADLEAVAGELNGRLAALGSHATVTARQIAVRVSNQMATRAITEYQSFALNGSKKSRRRELLRAAQAKFRRAHGNRAVYVPLGMTAVVT